ncbi:MULTISPECIES: spore cortex biosynthesis protein YabQ [Bacillus]|uniref:spore cortex biosynthesis protein YabQ n=1 Tax=Bacillus TaxID=1386 RepID=UPI000BB88ED6|nr:MULTISPECIES: spore cortex biosynthesis protein YabQ [Bacillus]
MSLTVQFYTMIAMIGVGVWLGIAIDTYNRFLKRENRAKWIVFANDILFWLLQGLVAFYVLLLVNEGELRFYILIALVCGFAAYQALLKYVYLSLLETVIQITIAIYQFIYKLVMTVIVKPIKWIVQAIIATLLFLLHVLYSIGKFLVKFIWKTFILLTLPIKWLFVLIWKLLPRKMTDFLLKTRKQFAGYLVRGKNFLIKLVKHAKKIWKR